ncbi:hypothetical protein DSL72_003126 [Monilinia vaccinii-corymbosi]|uniref:SET domain-containing protein n=1 Tax=Monilinia vaccinii-corymbosi TaxID=61207 RepID=A0A8A3P8Q6_9HELO|nr:hypothetical protein DSL72_003126 [Monilinia vaccinii-corymbosi]
MDIVNVSEDHKYLEILNRQKAVLNAAMARQGHRPKDMKSRQELISQFMMIRMSQLMSQSQTQNGSQMRISWVPLPYEPSITPLEDLTPIHIKDLRLETHHRGRYLLVRALTPAHRITGIIAIVEDENADALPLQIYQQPDEKLRPATSVIAEKDVFLVKEPYLKTAGDGGYGLRVDHVSDLVCLDGNHEILPKNWKSRGVIDLGKTADDWKQEGNLAMGEKRYWAAIQSYTAALQCHPSTEAAKTIHLNRALAHLRDGSFDAALADTQCTISPSDVPEKALYRAGQALYGLGRFSECHDTFESLCKRYPSNSIAATALMRARRRLAEQESGMYDFASIYKEIRRTRPPHLDHATFVGPVVVKPSPGRGQGLFTTKAVKAGELLLCEKAFAHCYAETSEYSKTNSQTTLLVNLHTNRMTLGTQSDLITTIVQKLWRNPSLIPKFTTLHHGSFQPVERIEVDKKPVIDTFLVERSIALNVFGCPTSSYEAHSTVAKSGEDEYKHHSCGIWLMASKINHSCLSNTQRSFLGDLQLVRATCDIPAETELTFWYTEPAENRRKIKKALGNWGFQCKCIICLDLEETTSRQSKTREKSLGDLEVILRARNVDTAKAEHLLVAIDGTYKHPPTKVPRIVLREPYLRLAEIYAKQGIPNKAVSMTLKALASLGFVIKNASLPAVPGKHFEVEKWGLLMDGVAQAWIYLCKVYVAFAPQFVQQAEDCARLAHKMWYGEDHTFKVTYDG